MKNLIFIIIIFIFLNNIKSENIYTVTVERLNNEKPFISPENSEFSYNYNPGCILNETLLVRCQMNTSDSSSNPYSVSPSFLSLAGFSSTSNDEFTLLNNLTKKDVAFHPDIWYETFGTEDPRIVFRNSKNKLIMMYTAVQTLENGNVIARLSMAKADPNNLYNWQRFGSVFPDKNMTQFTKSGALLIRDYNPPHILIFGDSSEVPGLQYATTSSDDLTDFQIQPGLFLPVRNETFFDSKLVEAGPEPLMLSNGNYLFLYNSARICDECKSDKPGYNLQYNIGYAILNGSNPRDVIKRSSEPILSPQLSWETDPSLLTPNVVFVEGWYRSSNLKNDEFIMFYGASDNYVGIAKITVSIS